MAKSTAKNSITANVPHHDDIPFPLEHGINRLVGYCDEVSRSIPMEVAELHCEAFDPLLLR